MIIMYKDSIQFTVDPAKCIRCEKCTADCQNRAIEPDPATGLPRVAPDGGTDRCMHCRHCLMICPVAAISVDGIDPARCLPANTDLPSADSLLSLIRSRRSVRDYKQKNVDRAVLNWLLDAMRYVPTGVNFHQLHFSVIDDIDVMSAYRNRIYSQVRDLFENGGISDEQRSRFENIYFQHKAGKDPVFRTAPHMLMVSVPANAPCPDADPLIAVSYFELLARSKGVGTCWFGRILFMWRDLLPDMLKIFRIPEGYKPGYAILFGETDVVYPRTGDPDPVHITRAVADDMF